MANTEKEAVLKKRSTFVGVPQSEISRLTSAEYIFNSIYAEIASMRLEPGTKLSEVDIANQFEVSRQPVREAFFRLSNMKLLQVRPQRATIVRKISKSDIADARFIRAAIEVEIARIACEKFKDEHVAVCDEHLQRQEQAVAANDFDSFHALDGDFHNLLCKIAERESAASIIDESRAPVDRLCVLSLARRTEFEEVYRDHVKIINFLKQGDEANLIAVVRQHLSRLDATITEVSRTHADYFEE